MRRGVLWLCSDLSNGVTGGRFIARHWGDEGTEAEKAEAARDDGVLWPV